MRIRWDLVVAELDGARLRLVRPFQRGFGPSRVTAVAAHSGQVAALAQDVLDLADNDKLYPAGLERIELPGVGHFVQRERPGAVGEVLKRMLQV